MGHEFSRTVRRGAVRLAREWRPDEDRQTPLPTGGGGSNAGGRGVSTAGRVVSEFSARSRRSLRYDFAGRAWEALGSRPAMVTLTYPLDWRAVCEDADALRRHREAFKEAWRREFGPPIGTWHVEFQPRNRQPEEYRQAPHMHMYLGLPNVMGAEEFGGLQARTMRRHWLEERYGKYAGRSRTPPPRGEVSDFLLATWARIVGSAERAHRTRGVDITPAFWTDDVAAAANRSAIADYFWSESGKFGQKHPPESFGSLRFWGVWGQRLGFVIVEGKSEIELRQFYRERRVYRRLVQQRLRREAAKTGVTPRQYKGPRGRDGLTVFLNDAPAVAGRVAQWAAQ